MHRRVSDHNHNSFLLQELIHKPTKVAPSRVLKSLSRDLRKALDNRTQQLLRELSPLLGTPYFSAPGFILYKGDCMELLEKLSTWRLSINLAITSPPYNIGKEYERPLPYEEYIDWCAQWIKRIHDITCPDGAFWLNLGYFEVPKLGLCVPIPYLLWGKSPFYLLQEVVWHYGAGVSAKKRLSPRNEKWLFYVKDPKHYTFNLDDIRDPNVKYPNQKKNGKYRCNPLGKNPSDVWRFPKVTTGKNRSSKERTDHPAQFPLAVVERIVLASSNELDLVLDPFAGSCSAGIASVGLGRIFLGFELREDYCDMSVERFKAFKKKKDQFETQPALFS